MSSPAGPPAKRRRLDFSKSVTVIAGEEEKPFSLHKDVLGKHSTFFRRVFSNGFKESQEKVVRLPDVNEDLLTAYVQWSYSGEIVLMETEEEEKQDYGAGFGFRLAQFYVVADVLGDTLLRNAIVDRIISMYKANRPGPTAKEIALAYRQTPEGSKLRQLVVHWHAERVAYGSKPYAKWLADQRALLPAEFVFDTLLIAAAGTSVDPRKAKPCVYHDHDEDVPDCIGEGEKTP